MSSYKMLVGHSLCDGSGRDTYIKCRPNSQTHVYMSKKLSLGPEHAGLKRARRGGVRIADKAQIYVSYDGKAPVKPENPPHRPTTEYRDLFVPDYENGSRPYIPKAKSFMENKAVAGFAQKTGDLVRFAGRRTDQLRRDVDERERILKLHRLNIAVDPVKTRKRDVLHKTLQPVLERSDRPSEQETTAVERWPETSMHPHSRGQAGPEDDVLEAYVERRSRAGSRMPTARGMTSAAGGVTGLGDVSDARGQTRSRTALGMHRETRTASAAGLRSSSGLCRSSSALGQVQTATVSLPALQAAVLDTQAHRKLPGKVPAHHGTIGREEGEWVWVRVPFDE